VFEGTVDGVGRCDREGDEGGELHRFDRSFL
jgi:hypothetical protein